MTGAIPTEGAGVHSEPAGYMVATGNPSGGPGVPLAFRQSRQAAEAELELRHRSYPSAAVYALHRVGGSAVQSDPSEDFEALLLVLDPFLGAPDMAAWERRDRRSKAEHQARRLLAAYRLVARPAPTGRTELADRFGGRPARGVTP